MQYRYRGIYYHGDNIFSIYRAVLLLCAKNSNISLNFKFQHLNHFLNTISQALFSKAKPEITTKERRKDRSVQIHLEPTIQTTRQKPRGGSEKAESKNIKKFTKKFTKNQVYNKLPPKSKGNRKCVTKQRQQ